jgi:hypothetical protein
MPPTITAAEPNTAAATFPRPRLAAGDHIPAAASNIDAARQVAAERPRPRAAGHAP